MSEINSSRRKFVSGLLLSAAAVPMLGTLDALAQAQTLRVFASGDGKSLKAVMDAFKQSSGSDVGFEGVPFADYQNTIVQRFRTGNSGIDVFLVDPTYVPTFSQRDFLGDLTGAFADKSNGVLFPSDVQGASYQGKMLTMPLWESTQLLYFNRALLQKAGIEIPGTEPDSRMTWEALLDLAKKAQASGSEWGFGFEQVDRYYQLQILPESLGGGPGVKGDDLLTVDVANDAWVAAGKWYGSLYADKIAPSGPKDQEMRDLFTSGRLAFFVAGPWNIAGFNKVEGLDYGVAPHPYFASGKPVTPSESWHLGIAKGAANEELAFKFLDFAGLTTEGAMAAAADGSLSANIEAATKLLAAIPANNPGLAGADELIRYELANTAIRRPRTLGYLQLEELVSRAWGDIRNGGDATSTFTQLQSELERSFQRVGH